MSFAPRADAREIPQAKCELLNTISLACGRSCDASSTTRNPMSDSCRAPNWSGWSIAAQRRVFTVHPDPTVPFDREGLHAWRVSGRRVAI